MKLFRTLAEIFSHKWVAVLAVIVAFLTFAFSMWVRNLSLIITTFRSPLFSINDSLTLMLGLLGGLATNVTLLGATLIIVTSVLFGVNAGLFVFYIQRKRILPHFQEGTATAGGLLTALLGVGCASCGTFMLGAVLSSIGAGSLLAFLPLGGHEFLIISVALLVISIYSTVRSIESSNVCKVTNY